jgi:hypothetical protein
MTGVEILATSEVVAAYEFSWGIYIGAIIIFIVLMTIASICSVRYVGTEDIVIGAITGLVFGATLGLFPAHSIIPSEYKTHYKVTISDEVSMNDFLERYEIVDQEGKIYTVRERDGVEDDN